MLNYQPLYGEVAGSSLGGTGLDRRGEIKSRKKGKLIDSNRQFGKRCYYKKQGDNFLAFRAFLHVRNFRNISANTVLTQKNDSDA